MKVLITGANGFLGSHLVERLIAEGCEVGVLVRPSAKIHQLEKLPVQIFRGYLESGSLWSTDKLSQWTTSCDYVFHVAGGTAGFTKQDFVRANVDTTRALAEFTVAQAKQLKRFVFVSSQAAIGPGSIDSVSRDHQTPNPKTWYGESKQEAEKILDGFSDRLNWVAIRPPGIIGPRDQEFVPLYRSVLRGWIPLIVNRHQHLALATVHDVVEALWKAAIADPERVPSGSRFLVGGSQSVTTLELGQWVAEALQVNARPILIPLSLVKVLAGFSQGVGRLKGKAPVFTSNKVNELSVSDWRLDDSPARDLFGYEPKSDLRAGLEEAIQWSKDQGLL